MDDFGPINVKAMFFGDPGIGKTTGLSKSYKDPRIGPMLWIGCESSCIAIQSKLKRWYLEDFKNKKTAETDSIAYGKLSRENGVAELNRIITYLRSTKKDEKPYLGFKSIVLDSLTAFDNLSIADAMKYNTDHNVKGCDGTVPKQQDFLRNSYNITAIFNELNDLDTHLFLIAHAMQSEENGIPIVYPNISGQLKVKIPALLQVVAYVQSAKGGDREYIFQPGDASGAKEVTMVKDIFEDSKVGRSQTFKKEDHVLTQLFDLWGIGE